MTLPAPFLDKLRTRLPLAPLVGRVIPLRRWRGNWRGPCFITQDGQQAFFVSGKQPIYHCYACGAHGDILAFFRECADGPYDQRVTPDSHEAWDAQDRLRIARFRALVPFLANAAGLTLPGDFPAEGKLSENPLAWLPKSRIGAGWITKASQARGHGLIPPDFSLLVSNLADTFKNENTVRLVQHDLERQRLVELLCRRAAPTLYNQNRRERLSLSITGYDWEPHGPTRPAYAELKLNFARNAKHVEIRHANGPLAELASLTRVITRRLREIAGGQNTRRLRHSFSLTPREVTHRRIPGATYSLPDIS